MDYEDIDVMNLVDKCEHGILSYKFCDLCYKNGAEKKARIEAGAEIAAELAAERDKKDKNRKQRFEAAKAAMANMVSIRSSWDPLTDVDVIAKVAVKHADALLKELSK